MRFAFVWATLCACATTPTSSATVTNQSKSTASDPIEVARSVEAKRGNRTACLSFVVEDTNSTGEIIAVRERHDESCPGDPNVSPVIDRVRVLPTGVAERYDAARDAWFPAS